MLAETLTEFCRSLGLSEEEITRNETPAMHTIKTEVLAGDLKRLALEDLRFLVKVFDGSLSLTLGIPEAPLLEVTEGRLPDDLEQKLVDIQKRADQAHIPFELTLDKAKLLAQHGLDGSQAKAIYYFFGQNLAALLDSPLPQLDTVLFDGRDRPTVVILSDAAGRYCSPLFYLFGQDGFQAAQACARPPKPVTLERVQKYHAATRESLNWVGFELENLTPLHFLGADSAQGLPEIVSTLHRHLLTLCIVYTANRSSYDGRQFQAVYASAERAATLALEAPGEDGSEWRTLSTLALWPYSGKETDRLTILQNVAARQLVDEDPAQNFHSFVHQLKHLLSEARWHHRVFLDGQIGKHFEQAQAVTDYVAQRTQEVSEALDKVTKGLADNLLAAVGVIVLSLLASLVKNEVQGLIFMLSMRIYAAYLFLFQGVYRMASVWQSYQLLQQETGEQIADYTQRLGRRKVEPLTRPFERRRRQFLNWFWGTLGLYLLFSLVFWWLGGSLPVYLAGMGVMAATPTAVP